MTAYELLIVVVAAIGSLLVLISSIGIVRLPDVYARMHALGKASTLGVSCILLSAGLYFGGHIFMRMMAFIILFFITAPIATTAMARAAYRTDHERQFILHYDDIAAHAQQESNPPPSTNTPPAS